jgi:hypothetical protein
MYRYSRLFPIVLLLGFVSLGIAQSTGVPRLLTYQGSLMDANGTPLNNPTQPIAITLYDDASGINNIWSHTFVVPVVNGVFSVLLGDGFLQSLPFPTVQPVWLGVTPGAGPEMSPLTQLTTAPYSFMAEDMNHPYLSAMILDSNALITERGGTFDLIHGSNITFDAKKDAHGNVSVLIDAVGSIAGVTAGSGLKGGGLFGEVTVALADSGVASRHLATGSVTSSKIAWPLDQFSMTGGAFTCAPTSTTWLTNKPATVKLADGSRAKLFSEESAEVYFTDYGHATLASGRAHVAVDARFAQTVTIDEAHPMLVFVQPEGECANVYVANKSSNGFDVIESNSGHSSVPFSYRVVCKRKHYENERLAGDESDRAVNAAMLNSEWPEFSNK